MIAGLVVNASQFTILACPINAQIRRARAILVAHPALAAVLCTNRYLLGLGARFRFIDCKGGSKSLIYYCMVEWLFDKVGGVVSKKN